MGRLNLRSVRIWTDKKTGRTYTRFRYRGYDGPLPHPNDPGFGTAYDRLMRTVAGVSVKTPAPSTTSLDWLIRAYQQSPEWKRLADRTRSDYAALLSEIASVHGAKSYQGFTKSRIMQYIRDPLATTPRKADAAVVALASTFKWAVGRDLIDANPCRGIGKLYQVGTGYRAWTADEISRFLGVCSDWEWLVFCMGLYLTQRPGDLVKLTWFQYDGACFTVRQGKTKAPLIIDVHPVLKATLSALPRTDGTIITRADETPYRDAQALGGRWSKAMERHGLKGCTIHGLRRTGPTVVAEAGATDAQLMSMTGHKTTAMVRHYTQAAKQRRLNKSAVALVPTLKRGL